MNVRDLSKDEILSALGFDTRRSVWPTLGIFAGALVIGAAVGMLLAPRRGSELRSEIGEKLQSRVRSGKRDLEAGMASGSGSTTPY